MTTPLQLQLQLQLLHDKLVSAIEKGAPRGAFLLFMQSIKFLLGLFGLAALAACQGVNPVVDTAQSMFVRFDAQTAYRQGFEYINLHLDGRQAAMALGYRETDGRNVNEFWYSGQREMLHLQNGRIHAALGMTNEVRELRQPAPDWGVLLQRQGPFVWQRTMDVQPGYRYGVVESVVTQRFTASKAQMAKLAEPAEWFEDLVTSKTQDGRPWSYRQIFALVNLKVVYSEQCLAPHLCFTLQPVGVVNP